MAVEYAVYFNAEGEEFNPNPEGIMDRISVLVGADAFRKLVNEHDDAEDDEGDRSELLLLFGGGPVLSIDMADFAVFDDGCVVERRSPWSAPSAVEDK